MKNINMIFKTVIYLICVPIFIKFQHFINELLSEIPKYQSIQGVTEDGKIIKLNMTAPKDIVSVIFMISFMIVFLLLLLDCLNVMLGKHPVLMKPIIMTIMSAYFITSISLMICYQLDTIKNVTNIMLLPIIYILFSWLLKITERNDSNLRTTNYLTRITERSLD